MKHIAIYVRASTTKQDTGVDSQKRAIETFINQKGLSHLTVKVYEDLGFSGSNSNRPALVEMLNAVSAKEVDSVICYSFSRISRSIRDLIDIVATLETNGVHFHSLSESVDTSTPFGRCFLHIIASLNQAERETLVERTKSGLKAALARGSILGRPMTRNATLIRELRSNGYSYEQISELAGCSISTVWRELRGISQKSESAK